MLIEHFIEYLKNEKRYSPHTTVSYRVDLNQFAGFVRERYNVDSLSSVSYPMVRAWLMFLLEERSLSARTVNRKLSSLKSFCRFMIRSGLIKTSPLDKITSPKTRKRLPLFIEEEKLSGLLDNTDFGDDYTGVRNRMIIEMLYHTGIRRSELINLRKNDVDLPEMTLRVVGKGNRERLIPLSRRFASFAGEYLKLREDFFRSSGAADYFLLTSKGEKLYPRLVNRIVKVYLDTITSSEKKSPHVIRHSFATHMLNHGAGLNAIKELLGHANLSATEVYTHNTFEKLKKIYKQAHPRA